MSKQTSILKSFFSQVVANYWHAYLKSSLLCRVFVLAVSPLLVVIVVAGLIVVCLWTGWDWLKMKLQDFRFNRLSPEDKLRVRIAAETEALAEASRVRLRNMHGSQHPVHQIYADMALTVEQMALRSRERRRLEAEKEQE